MPKKYNVQVSSAAYNKLYQHSRFLARVSVPAAERLYADFNEAGKFLENHPESCPQYITLISTDANLKYKLFGDKNRYRIVFEIIGNIVFAYDIQDCRQGTDKSLID